MLTKLMKHEFLATGRVMLPLYLLLVVVSVGVNLSVHGMTMADNPLFDLLAALFSISYVLIIFAAFLLCLVVVVVRFYRNMMGPEGYLTLTLPVSVHQHVMSKLFIALLWMILTGAAVGLSAMLIFLGRSLPMTELLDVLRHELLQMNFNLHGVAVLTVLLSLLHVALLILQFYAACAIGGSFANSKVMLSVAFFFAIQLILSAANNLIGEAGMALFSGNSPEALLHFSMGLDGAMMAVEAVIFYFITTYFLKNRINLE